MNETGTREEKTIAKRIVLNISRMTTHNGPGIRTLIMFKGCPLRYIWCSTPESQKSEPELAVFPVKCNKCGECIPICPSNALALTNDTICVNRSLCNSYGKCTKACYSEALKLLGQPMSVDDLLEEVKKDLIIALSPRTSVRQEMEDLSKLLGIMTRYKNPISWISKSIGFITG